MKESSGCLSKGDGGSGNGDGLFSVLRSCMRTKGDFFPCPQPAYSSVSQPNADVRGERERRVHFKAALCKETLYLSAHQSNLLSAYSGPVIREIQSPDEIKKNLFHPLNLFLVTHEGRVAVRVPFISLMFSHFCYRLLVENLKGFFSFFAFKGKVP